MFELFIALIVVYIIVIIRNWAISTYKISYYEQRLENNDIDVSSVKNMGFLDIWRL